MTFQTFFIGFTAVFLLFAIVFALYSMFSSSTEKTPEGDSYISTESKTLEKTNPEVPETTTDFENAIKKTLTDGRATKPYELLPEPSQGGKSFILHVENVQEYNALLPFISGMSGSRAVSEGFVPVFSRLPVVSLSLSTTVGGGEKADFCGAALLDIRASDLLKRMLDGKFDTSDLEILTGMKKTFNVTRIPFEENIYSVDISRNFEGKRTRYGTIYLASKKGLVLFGETKEGVKACLESSDGKRPKMQLPRVLSHENFILFSNRESSSFGVAVSGVPVEVEVGFGFRKDGPSDENIFELSAVSNFARVFGLPTTAEPLSPEDIVLIGERKPWLVFASRMAPKEWLDTMEKGADSGDMFSSTVLDILKNAQIQKPLLEMAMKTFGIVLGEDADYDGAYIPGGYAYIAGDENAVLSLLPVVEPLIASSGISFRGVPIRGWKASTIAEKPVSLVAGIRENAFIVGAARDRGMSKKQNPPSSLVKMLKDGTSSFVLHIDGDVFHKTAISVSDGPSPFFGIFSPSMLSELRRLVEATAKGTGNERIDIIARFKKD